MKSGSVLLETSVGDIVIDVHCEEAPKTALNFLKLCKSKYYNNCIFHNVQRDLLAQTGDPTWSGSGGESVFAQIYGSQARLFEGEPREGLNHARVGSVAMAVAGRQGKQVLHGSQFYVTLAPGKRHLDGTTVFGHVAEGLDVLERINSEAYADDKGRPYRNIRIKHVAVLEDPFPDPPNWVCNTVSPRYVPLDHRKEADDKLLAEEMAGKTQDQIEEEIAAKEAQSRTDVLVTLGDIQDGSLKPPDDVLFVCKLHPVTQEDDLEVIFGRFGPLKKVEIIRDRKTGTSLGYGFVHFETKEACIAAYTKMDNVLIDEKRIHVDFCQSVPKIWNNRMFGVPLSDDVAREAKTKVYRRGARCVH